MHMQLFSVALYVLIIMHHKLLLPYLMRHLVASQYSQLVGLDSSLSSICGTSGWLAGWLQSYCIKTAAHNDDLRMTHNQPLLSNQEQPH